MHFSISLLPSLSYSQFWLCVTQPTWPTWIQQFYNKRSTVVEINRNRNWHDRKILTDKRFASLCKNSKISKLQKYLNLLNSHLDHVSKTIKRSQLQTFLRALATTIWK